MWIHKLRSGLWTCCIVYVFCLLSSTEGRAAADTEASVEVLTGGRFSECELCKIVDSKEVDAQQLSSLLKELKLGGILNGIIDECDVDGLSPLVHAIRMRDRQKVQVLIDSGATLQMILGNGDFACLAHIVAEELDQQILATMLKRREKNAGFVVHNGREDAFIRSKIRALLGLPGPVLRTLSQSLSPVSSSPSPFPTNPNWLFLTDLSPLSDSSSSPRRASEPMVSTAQGDFFISNSGCNLSVDSL
ncbi:MAG: hypothetical protein HQK53_04565 [Oligoflexia bacterium]|nr:hypothetical protein [Oligoflexia bacterium]